MKKVLILILMYFLLQIPAIPVAWLVAMAYSYIQCGVLDFTVGEVLYVPLTLLFGNLFLALYLWKKNYLTDAPQTFSLLTPSRMGWCLFAGFASIYLIGVVISELTFLPNWFESTFDVLQSGWTGILTIAVIGPVVEELFFRGAITKELLAKYSPTNAILISAFVFGIIHVNPIQTINAFFMGLMLAWLYYKTCSLMPGILLHVLNNAFTVYVEKYHPEWNEIQMLHDPIAIVAAVIVLGLLWISIKKINSCNL